MATTILTPFRINQFSHFGSPSSGKAKAIIVDIDNTLVNTPPPPSEPYDQVDWDTVVLNNESCDPNQDVLFLVRAILFNLSTTDVIYMTGRNSGDVQKQSTIRWLERHHIYDPSRTPLYMRTPGDWRADPIIKKELTVDATRRYDIMLCIDDRPSNIDMWKTEFNIPCMLYVPRKG
jgi:predicted secreted acid phosphatase